MEPETLPENITLVSLDRANDAMILACRGLAFSLKLEIQELDSQNGHHFIVSGDNESLLRLVGAMNLLTGVAAPPSQRPAPPPGMVEIDRAAKMGEGMTMPLPKEMSTDGAIRVGAGTNRIASIGTVSKQLTPLRKA